MTHLFIHHISRQWGLNQEQTSFAPLGGPLFGRTVCTDSAGIASSQSWRQIAIAINLYSYETVYLAKRWGTCAMQNEIMCGEPAKCCGAWIVSERSLLYTSAYEPGSKIVEQILYKHFKSPCNAVMVLHKRPPQKLQNKYEGEVFAQGWVFAWAWNNIVYDLELQIVYRLYIIFFSLQQSGLWRDTKGVKISNIL